MRGFSIAGLTLGLAVSVGWAVPPPDPLMEDILELAVRPPHAAFTGKKLVVSWYGKNSRAREVRVFYKPPNRWRHEVLSPSGSVVKTTIQNGTKEWVLHEGYDVVLERDIRGIRHGELDRAGLRRLFAENFQVKDAGQREFIGVASRGVVLTPSADAGPRRALWVDPQTGIVMHRRQTNHRGRSIQESRMTHLDLKEDLPDDLFTPSLVDKKMIRESERKAIATPADLAKHGLSGEPWLERLPFGYRLDTVRALPIARNKIVAHFRYSNGLSVLSVFRSPYKIDASDYAGEREDEGDADTEFAAVSWAGNFLAWKTGEQYVLVVADLSRTNLQDIRRSLTASKD